MTRVPLHVVAVSGDALRSELLEALSSDGSECDIIVVESIARGYSRIRELRPDVVVVFMEIDDVDACQLLAMLDLDRQVRGIPVVTCTTGSERADTHVLRGCGHQSPGSVGAAPRGGVA